ncbi:hypothetical protein E2562_013407 [Oryza meyeriana var. granulata]|uniref:Uncharacterized protein n=1 Tax=Oryza meyeriana var. granulata TaxID=110450 RepID=A0A6G1EA69_9ORYZ|nr:hypothetical protein E2562_013407 [Oryza meyeriana var. granulata]
MGGALGSGRSRGRKARSAATPSTGRTTGAPRVLPAPEARKQQEIGARRGRPPRWVRLIPTDWSSTTAARFPEAPVLLPPPRSYFSTATGVG